MTASLSGGKSNGLSRMQVAVGAGVFHPHIQGTVFAPSTFIFDLEMQYFPWKYHVQHGQGSSRDPVPQEGQ